MILWALNKNIHEQFQIVINSLQQYHQPQRVPKIRVCQNIISVQQIYLFTPYTIPAQKTLCCQPYTPNILIPLLLFAAFSFFHTFPKHKYSLDSLNYNNYYNRQFYEITPSASQFIFKTQSPTLQTPTPLQHTTPYSQQYPKYPLSYSINSLTFNNKQQSLVMSKEIISIQQNRFGCMNLENDLPFSMSTQSDKEVLLFPLSSDIDKEYRPDENIKRMIDEFIDKQRQQKIVRINIQDIKISLKMQTNPFPEHHLADISKHHDNLKFSDIQFFEQTVVSEQSSSFYNPVNTLCLPTTKLNHSQVINGKKRGPYKKYSQTDKENLVNQAKKYGINHVTKKKNIARKTLCRWMTDGVVRKYGGGRQIGDIPMEAKLMIEINHHFQNTGSVLCKQKIQQMAIRLTSNPVFTASHGWFQKFYMRHKEDLQRMMAQQLRAKLINQNEK